MEDWDVKCPVMWLHVSSTLPGAWANGCVFETLRGAIHPCRFHSPFLITTLTRSPFRQGTDDAVYSVANAEEEIESSNCSRMPKWLSWSHPEEVDNALIQFVGKWAK
jgi:hypothetical protein